MKIKELRIIKGLSQQDFARQIGISQGTLSNYETEQIIPPPEKLTHIASVMGVELNDLLEDYKPFYSQFDLLKIRCTSKVTDVPMGCSLDDESPAFAGTTSKSANLEIYADIINRGICELCGEKAPFCDADGTPYLKKYLIRRPSLVGLDEPDNVAFLCPNCYDKMKVLNRPEDIEAIRKNVKIRPEMRSDMGE